MKLHKMIEMYLKYDNMHTNRKINAFICINNHINSCINCMLLVTPFASIWDLAKGQSKGGSDSKGGQCPLLSAQIPNTLSFKNQNLPSNITFWINLKIRILQ